MVEFEVTHDLFCWYWV